MSLAIIVPVRVASTRFPNKLLHPVHGKPLLLWTAERIRKEAPDFDLYFAVESEAMATLLAKHGYVPIMTSICHTCGTERVAEANRRIGADYVINVQADEPMVTGRQIHAVAEMLDAGEEMATVGNPMGLPSDYQDPNQVKVVVDNAGYALYFSRASIPHCRETQGSSLPKSVSSHAMVHVGIYGYQKDLLESLSQFKPGVLEQVEKLEQLRAMENGTTIAVYRSEEIVIGINTPDQMVRFEDVSQQWFDPR